VKGYPFKVWQTQSTLNESEPANQKHLLLVKHFAYSGGL